MCVLTLPDDSPSPQLLPANGLASYLPPWRPTTCQVTVATGEEGTVPMAIDTYPPTRSVSVACDLHPWFLSEILLGSVLPLYYLTGVVLLSFTAKYCSTSEYKNTSPAAVNRSDFSSTHSCTATWSPCTEAHEYISSRDGVRVEASRMELNFIDHQQQRNSNRKQPRNREL